MSLKIEKLPTKKHGIPQRFHMQEDVIPKHPKISIFTGPAGSGKSTLVGNLLSRDIFYGPSYEGIKIPRGKEVKYQRRPVEAQPYFDHIILLMGSADDMYDDLIEEGTISQVVKNPKVSQVAKIIKAQEDLIDEADGDILKVPKLLIIAEDLVSNKKLMNSDAFRDLSIKNRHLNASIWYLGQYINLIPKAIREQASNIFIFQCTAQCQDVLMEQFRDPGVSKSEFMKMLAHATEVEESGHRNFLHINKTHRHKFRKNLDTYLHFNWQDSPQTSRPHPKEVKREFKKEAADPDEIKDKAEAFPVIEEVVGKEVKSKVEPPAKPKSYLIGGRFVQLVI